MGMKTNINEATVPAWTADLSLKVNDAGQIVGFHLNGNAGDVKATLNLVSASGGVPSRGALEQIARQFENLAVNVRSIAKRSHQ